MSPAPVLPVLLWLALRVASGEDVKTLLERARYGELVAVTQELASRAATLSHEEQRLLAYCQQCLGDFSASLATLDRLLVADPEDVEVRSRRADCLWSLRRYREASELYRELATQAETAERRTYFEDRRERVERERREVARLLAPRSRLRWLYHGGLALLVLAGVALARPAAKRAIQPGPEAS